MLCSLASVVEFGQCFIQHDERVVPRIYVLDVATAFHGSLAFVVEGERRHIPVVAQVDNLDGLITEMVYDVLTNPT
jgi:hypothetical protein